METMLDIRTVGARIAVQPDEPVTETPGGIQLLEDTESIVRGTVVAVGNKVEDVGAGDRVIFQKYAGIGVDNYLIIGYNDILLIE